MGGVESNLLTFAGRRTCDVVVRWLSHMPSIPRLVTFTICTRSTHSFVAARVSNPQVMRTQKSSHFSFSILSRHYAIVRHCYLRSTYVLRLAVFTIFTMFTLTLVAVRVSNRQVVIFLIYTGSLRDSQTLLLKVRLCLVTCRVLRFTLTLVAACHFFFSILGHYAIVLIILTRLFKVHLIIELSFFIYT